MRDWVFERFQYVPGSSNAQTTALDTFVQRQGVCRDYAHVMIALARASAIPARFVSVYAPYVTPQDFHAVAEVYLDGTWHLVDATGMAAANQIARIGVGLDAAEVSFLSSFGQVMLQNQSVQVTVDT
jgi:transglutaminase-like putative cysteine protease